MARILLAATLGVVILAAPASACTAPREPMPFDVWKYGNRPVILIREGQCVIDPGFWIYTPPPHQLLLGEPPLPM